MVSGKRHLHLHSFSIAHFCIVSNPQPILEGFSAVGNASVLTILWMYVHLGVRISPWYRVIYLLSQWLSSNKNCPACNAKCSPPISPASSTNRLPLTPPKSPPLSISPSLKSFPTPPPSATAISFEGYQIQSTFTIEHDLPIRSFSPLSSSIIGIVSGRTPVIPASLGMAVGDFLMWFALALFISVFVPSLL